MLCDLDEWWIVGFVVDLGTLSVEGAEFSGILHGLYHSWNAGDHCVEVESDNLVCVELMNGSDNGCIVAPLVEDITGLIHPYRDCGLVG